MATKKNTNIETSPATVSASPSKPAATTKPGVDVAGLDELSYQFQMEGLKRQERSHNLRGQVAKVEAARLDADKQEVRVERKQEELGTEQQKLIKAKDDHKGHTADAQLNRISWIKKLGQRSYNISGDVSFLQKAQSAIKSAPLQSLSDMGGE